MTKKKKFTEKKSVPLKTMPLDVGMIHLVGIGGIGISGIAEILHNLGYKVKGSDITENWNVERLRKKGIKVYIGHKKENVLGSSVVVISSAVKENNPEVVAARENKIPVVRRAEMLAEITRLKTCVAIAGTHGKTTTTAMTAALFTKAGLDPTVINGGIINAYGSNAFLGKGEWMVVEADESDATFIKIPSSIGVITNIDPEHLDFYGDFSKVKEAFKTFITNLPFYGFAVACNDHPVVRDMVSKITDRKIITYSVEGDADVVAKNIKSTVFGSVFDVVISERITGKAKRILKGIKLSVPGLHNVSNCLAPISIAAELKLPDKVIIDAFKNFEGVKRRFTKTGEVDGITIVDDYGHHPKEISATLKAARDVLKGRKKGNLIAVVQPHRYTRVRDLFDDFCTCFGSADKVVVSEIYSAGEEPISGISREELIKGIKKNSKLEPIALGSNKELASIINDIGRPGDLVVCLGAGTITYWANELPAELQELRKKKKK